MKESLLAEIASALAEVAPEQIERVTARLGAIEDGDVVLGVIDDFEAQRLWVLGQDYERKHRLAGHAAQFDASTLEERDRFALAASRLRNMATIVRDMAWRRMEDIVGDRAELADTVGLRAGFTLVEPKPEPPAPPMMGTMPPSLPRSVVVGLIHGLQKQLEDTDAARAALEPKPKPQ